MERQEMIAIDTTTMPWEERYQAALGKSNFRKLLLQDPDTGMEIRLVRYPAGFMTTWHTHSCAHGMYVLEGTLVTHTGSYGPDSFVWFPEVFDSFWIFISTRFTTIFSTISLKK